MHLIRNFKISYHLQHFMINVFRRSSHYWICWTSVEQTGILNVKSFSTRFWMNVDNLDFWRFSPFNMVIMSLYGSTCLKHQLTFNYVCFGSVMSRISYFLMRWWWWWWRWWWWCLHCSKGIRLHVRSGSVLEQ